MGKLKERAITPITAKLLYWQQIGPLTFEGVIYNSITDDYEDNKWITLQFEEVTHYPKLSGHWSDHYLGRTRDREYFVLYLRNQRHIQYGS